MKYRFLRDHAGIYHVEKMCWMLEVSRSGYYVWRKRPMGRRRGENLRLVTEIRAVHRISKETYGRPRIHAQRISMDGKGRWMDNVFVERLWRSLKYEEVYLKAYESMAVD